MEPVPPLENTLYDAQLDGGDAVEAAAPSNTTSDLAALLGLEDSSAVAAPQSAPAPLAELFGGAVPAAEASQAGQAAVFTAYDSAELRITCSMTKSAANPQATDIIATYANTTTEPITNFVLQVSAAPCRFASLRCRPDVAAAGPAIG